MVCHCVRNYRRNITQPGSYFTRKFPLRKAEGGAKKCKSPLPSSSTRAFHFVPFGEQCKDVSIIGSSPCRVSRWYLITWCYFSALIQYTGGPRSVFPGKNLIYTYIWQNQVVVRPCHACKSVGLGHSTHL